MTTAYVFHVIFRQEVNEEGNNPETAKVNKTDVMNRIVYAPKNQA